MMPCWCMHFILFRNLCRRRAYCRAAQRRIPHVPCHLNNCASLSAMLHDSLPPHFAHHSASILSCLLGTSSACLIQHGTQDNGRHSRRQAGARCSHAASFGQTAVLPSMHIRPFISFSMHVCLGAPWAHGSWVYTWGLGESRFHTEQLRPLIRTCWPHVLL